MENNNSTLDFNHFFSILSETKLSFFYMVMFLLTIVLLITFAMKNVYRAEVILVPTESSGSSGGSTNEAAAQLASFAGISLNQGNGSQDKAAQALKILESREFIINFLKEYDFVHFIHDERSWNSSKNVLRLSNDYDSESNSWIRNKPTDMDTYREFINNHLKVVEDIETGFITVTIDHYSPFHANIILKSIIEGINNHMREIDLKYSTNAIEYLTAQLQLTNVSEVRNVFSTVIEDQIQTKMLANIADEYVLRILDPSRVPDRKYKPRRSAILAITFALALFTFVFVSFILFVQRKKMNLQFFPFNFSIENLD